MLEVLNDQVGRLVNCHPALNLAKKYCCTPVILEVSNDHSGKLVSAQL